MDTKKNAWLTAIRPSLSPTGNTPPKDRKRKASERRPDGSYIYLSSPIDILAFPERTEPVLLKEFFSMDAGLRISKADRRLLFRYYDNTGVSPAYQYVMTTLRKSRGGYDRNILKEIPNFRFSTISHVISFLKMYPAGIPEIPGFFLFYLPELTIRLHWNPKFNTWNVGVEKRIPPGRCQPMWSRILYPLVSIANDI